MGPHNVWSIITLGINAHHAVKCNVLAKNPSQILYQKCDIGPCPIKPAIILRNIRLRSNSSLSESVIVVRCAIISPIVYTVAEVHAFVAIGCSVSTVEYCCHISAGMWDIISVIDVPSHIPGVVSNDTKHAVIATSVPMVNPLFIHFFVIDVVGVYCSDGSGSMRCVCCCDDVTAAAELTTESLLSSTINEDIESSVCLERYVCIWQSLENDCWIWER